MNNALMLAGLFLALLLPMDEVRGQIAERTPRWSVGTSLTYPMARIYQIHIGYRLDQRHEMIFGPAYQNFESKSITSRAYTLLLGYRYYAWKGLNLEVELWPAYNSMYSSVTDSRYPGVELWTAHTRRSGRFGAAHWLGRDSGGATDKPLHDTLEFKLLRILPGVCVRCLINMGIAESSLQRMSCPVTTCTGRRDAASYDLSGVERSYDRFVLSRSLLL